MSPLFLIPLTAAAMLFRQGHQVDRELNMAGVDDIIEVDIRGIVTQDLLIRISGSENLFGNVAVTDLEDLSYCPESITSAQIVQAFSIQP